MKQSILVFLCALLCNLCFGQVVSDKLLTNLKTWHDNHPQEKVFVQTDRDRYLTGDAIWIKAWCTLDNKPSYLSKILYVELTDAKGNVADKKMLSLDAASSASTVFDVNSKLKSGNYSINAYTLWMLNFPEFVFRKSIYVYNNDYKTVGSREKLNYSLQLFPEGGDMTENISGRVAFKAVNSTGFPENVVGTVYTTAGEKITDFQSQHDGLGDFSLEPLPGVKYIAKATFKNGQTLTIDLPMPKKEGVNLQVQNTASRIFVVVNRNNINKEKYNKLFVIAQVNGLPVYEADFNIDEGRAAASIIKKSLPAGILQVTLFDSAGSPLAERLTFVDNYVIAKPALTNHKTDLKKRGKNILSFQLDSVVNPDLSALVVNREVSSETFVSESIASSLLLTSDLKGYIHNPGYYFSNKEKSTIANLDLLMLTHGWRRFKWEKIKSNETVTLKYPVETKLNIRGKVTKSSRTEPITSGFVTMFIKAEDSTSILSNAIVTDKGEFIVDSINYKSKATISYEGTNNKKEKLPVDVYIYPAFIDSLKISTYKPLLNLDTTVVTELNSAYFDYIKSGMSKLDTSGPGFLQGVTVKTKRLSPIDSLQKEYVSDFYSNSDQTLTIPENRSFVNIWQYLNQNISGFNVNPFQPGGVTNVRFTRYDGATLSDEDSAERFIKFLLNEVPVGAETIDNLNPSDVALIKVYKGALGFPFGADAGAIAIYTKKGVSVGSAVFDKAYAKYTKIGYSVDREFYSPDYTKNPELEKNWIDNRLTLFWNPKLKSNKEGNYTIEFHNSDTAKEYKVILQGIDANGKLIYMETIIK